MFSKGWNRAPRQGGGILLRQVELELFVSESKVLSLLVTESRKVEWAEV